eukprot:3932397-Rhodomonas_salina.1
MSLSSSPSAWLPSACTCRTLVLAARRAGVCFWTPPCSEGTRNGADGCPSVSSQQRFIISPHFSPSVPSWRLVHPVTEDPYVKTGWTAARTAPSA